MADIMASNDVIFEFMAIIKIRGANFCHVIRIKEFSHEILCIIPGNQKCRGAAPNFNLNVKIKDIVVAILIREDWLAININIIEANRKIDANA